MADTINVGIIGGGWPGTAHARGYLAAGGYRLSAVADLIPERRKKLMSEFSIPREYAGPLDLIADKDVAAVSVCVPNDLHVPIVTAALAAGKHVVCEAPPALDAGGAKKMQRSASRYGKVLLYALPRRYGGHEQAARQAIAKGYVGQVYHVRAAWTRTRAIPVGTGWYGEKARAGGGVMMDLGLPMLDLAWDLLGEPAAESVMAVAHQKFSGEGSDGGVEDAMVVLMRFAGGKTLELTAGWALNQGPQQNGALCRVYGDKAGIEVYTPAGATLYRDFKPTGEAKSTPLKPPKTVQHAAMMRHFRQCIIQNTAPITGADKGVALMRMVDAIYKSAAVGRSVEVKSDAKSEGETV